MEMGLKGKKALVCASSKGLGLAIAKQLYLEGVELVMCARNAETLESAATEVMIFAGRKDLPHICAIDLSKPESVGKLTRVVFDKLAGRCDILINNIGGPEPSAAATTTEAQWVRGFEQIFLSASLLSQALIPAMKSNRWGRIITVTSLSVLEPIDHLVVSTAMRSAVTTFMKTLSKELAGHQITVNTVLPGVIMTDRIVKLREAKAAREGTKLDTELKKTADAIPMQRLGRPEELASLVTFLASEQASYITGVNIPVDGGLRHSW
jgi:3-oxoacyl-[acyl-carrier protein] reductase